MEGKSFSFDSENPTMSEAEKKFRRGLEAMEAGEPETALGHFSDAVVAEPSSAVFRMERAQAQFKLERFKEAKADFDEVVSMVGGGGSSKSGEAATANLLLGRALMKGGVAAFRMGDLVEAHRLFSLCDQEGSEKGAGQWIVWCEERMAKLGLKSLEKSPAAAAKPQDPPIPQNAAESAAVAAAAAEAVAAATATAAKPATLVVSHDWYQTESQVVIEVRLKGADPAAVRVEFGPRSLLLVAATASYRLELNNLRRQISPEASSFRVTPSKVEVKLKKVEGVRWETLEGPPASEGPAADAAAPSMASLPTSAVPADPPVVKAAAAAERNKKAGKDWDKIGRDIEKEMAEEKPEGEQALNELFQKIYANADDNTRRAMNKSFSESGGTVLSTNWGEIGSKKTEVKPPEGMEFKKWES